MVKYLLKNSQMYYLWKKFFSNEPAEKADAGYYERVAEVYNISYRKFSQKDIANIPDEMGKIYSKVRDTVIGLASIKSIKDIVCTLELVNHKVLCEWSNVDEVLKEFNKINDHAFSSLITLYYRKNI